jgi:4-carboxymuconolactone decarboxylase
MSAEEAFVYDFACELSLNRGVCDGTYRTAVEIFGERGVIDLIGIIGYFTLISMVLNVARTPPESSSAIAALPPVPR